MLDLAAWLGAVYALWLAALPLAWLAFPNLNDRGTAFARPVALIVVGSAVWLLSLIGIVPSIPEIWWSAAVALGTAGWVFVVWKKRVELVGWVSTRWREVLLSELIFLLVFGAFALLKFNDPDIAGTEKPMDLTMLNAVTSSVYMPPEDLWLSGFSVAYYYFGYWMFAGVSQMAGVATSVGYNLSLALIAGMAGIGIFSLVGALVRRDGGNFTSASLAGFAAVLLLLAVSNLNGLWELLALLGAGSDGFYEWLSIKGVDTSEAGNGWRPTGFWWWWASSRVINSFGMNGAELDFTIQEFPFFSFLLGDLHPHVMSIPFLLLAVGMSANILWSPVKWGWRWIGEHRSTAFVFVLIVGTAGFINTWDLIIVVPLLGMVVLSKAYREGGYELKRALTAGSLPFLAVCAAAALVFSNFYFGTLESQLGFPPVAPTRHGTRLIHFVTVWLPLMTVAGFFVWSFAAQGVRRSFAGVNLGRIPFGNGRAWMWLSPMLACGFVYAAWFVTHMVFNPNASPLHLIERLPVSLPLAALVTVLVVAVIVRARRGSRDGAQLVLILLTLVASYVFFAEHFYVLDFFATRMNTIFKVYYQAWILLSVVGGYSVYHWLRMHSRFTGRRLALSSAAAVFAVLVIGVSLYYAVAAGATKAAESNTDPTFDGIAFIQDRSPDAAALINWVGENLDSDDVLVEAVGGSYSEFGRNSGFGGVSGVLGWPGHERQWRGGNEGWIEREGDVRRIYESDDLDEVRTLLDKYSVTHIVVGDLEREKYTGFDVSKFDNLGAVVYSNNRAVVYEVLR